MFLWLRAEPTGRWAGNAAMSQVIESADTVGAGVRRGRRIPVIWIIPLLALAIGAWLAWDTYSKRGSHDHRLVRQRRGAAGR